MSSKSSKRFSRKVARVARAVSGRKVSLVSNDNSLLSSEHKAKASPVATLPLNVESQLIETEDDLAKTARHSLLEFEALAVDREGWEPRDGDVETRVLGGKCGMRSVLAVRGAAILRGRSAAQVHQYLKTEQGMSLLDPKGEVLDMAPPILGPVALPGTAGTAHVEHIKRVGFGMKPAREMVLLVTCDDENTVTTMSSCLYSGVPGGSYYQRKVRPTQHRAILGVEYRCVAQSETSCFFICTWFMDLCGKSSPDSNSKLNVSLLKGVLGRLNRYAASHQR